MSYLLRSLLLSLLSFVLLVGCPTGGDDDDSVPDDDDTASASSPPDGDEHGLASAAAHVPRGGECCSRRRALRTSRGKSLRTLHASFPYILVID